MVLKALLELLSLSDKGRNLAKAVHRICCFDGKRILKFKDFLAYLAVLHLELLLPLILLGCLLPNPDSEVFARLESDYVLFLVGEHQGNLAAAEGGDF